MRIIVTGGRDYADPTHVFEALRGYHEATVIHGGAPGVDTLAQLACERLGIPTEVWPADWLVQGKGAGPRRNQQMVDEGADLCIAFPGGRGTADCVKRCVAAGIPIRRVT